MNYNLKGMVRGALTATAGLALLASTACKPSIDSVGWEDGRRSKESSINTNHFTLTSNPLLREGYMKLDVKENGIKKTVYVDFETNTSGEIRVKKNMFPDLRKGSQTTMEYVGDIKDGRLNADSLRGFSVEY